MRKIYQDVRADTTLPPLKKYCQQFIFGLFWVYLRASWRLAGAGNGAGVELPVRPA
jgi:hypothetical protein